MALVAYSDESDISDSDEEIVISTSKTEVHHKAFVSNQVLEDNTNQTTIDTIVRNDHKDQSKLNGIESIDDDDDDFIAHTNVAQSSVFVNIPEATPISKWAEPVLDVSEDTDEVTDVPTVKTWNLIQNMRENEPSATAFRTTVHRVHKNGKTKKVQIILPALSNYDVVDEDENDVDDEPKRKTLKPSTTGTGLFSLLPAPKQVKGKEVNRSLVPHILTKTPINRKKQTVPNKFLKPKAPSESLLGVDNDSGEEIDNVISEECTDFFSLTQKDEVDASLIPSREDTLVQEEGSILDNDKAFTIDTPVKNIEKFSIPITTEQHFYQNAEGREVIYHSEVDPELPETFNHEALMRLAGKGNRRKGEIINLIDFSADDALMNREEWVTKTLTEEKPMHSFSKKQEGMPSTTQKRKHQITYLAHQAKERELELKNTWAANRQTKMQSQAKYGF